jgi:uncharacterized caspase-like protein
MANTDWALAVGINKYPDPTFQALDGPEADAKDFFDWATSKEGGGVAASRAKLIVSSQFKPAADAIDAEPTAEAVQKFFERLDAAAQKNDEKGAGLLAGRRLYIYLSGHGFAPDEDETALLMANAAKNKLKHHVPGKAWANLFYRSGYFEEVLLFMDCCRNVLPQTILNTPSVSVRDNPQAIQNGHRLYAFATKWGAESRERVFAKGKSRGVFTMALMAGLRGGACEPGTDGITAMSLRSYLFNNMREFLAKQDLENPQIPKEPDIEPPNQQASDFPIVKVKDPPKGGAVRILLAPADAGKVINIRNGAFQIVKNTTAKPPEWKLVLPRGLYLAEIVGGPEAKPFEVKVSGVKVPGPGKEAVDVDFR